MVDRGGVCALFAAGLMLGTGAGPARAEHPVRVNYSGDLASGYDSNVANAELTPDIRSSGFVAGGAHATLQRDLSLYTTLLARGSLAGEHYDRFDGLANAKATALLRITHRADGAFYTPVLAAWLSAAYWEFDSAIRDSDEYRGGVHAIERITTAVSARLALAAVWRESDSSVFDLRGGSATLNLDWQLAPGTTAYAGYQLYHGDVVSTAPPTALKPVLAAEVIEPDDAFGGLAADQRAYRLDAEAHTGTVGLNYALSRRFAADVQGQYVDTRAAFGNEYRRYLALVSLLARF